MYAKKIVSILLVFLLVGCASVIRKDDNLSLVDRAKLDSNALEIWYVATYHSIQTILADPMVPEDKKEVIRKYINPKMNQFKRDMILFLDLLKGGEAVSNTDIVVTEAKLQSLSNDIINDMVSLGLVEHMDTKTMRHMRDMRGEDDAE